VTGTRWRHKKRGSTYLVVAMARLQVSGSAIAHLVDMAPMVVYQSENDGTIWTRSMAEFTDGRFERLYPAGHALHKEEQS